MIHTITASFDTIDLAELAAKKIKNDFSQVKTITIKYKNYPNTEREEIHPEFSAIAALAAPGAAISGAGALAGNNLFPTPFPADTDLNGTRFSNSFDEVPEIERTTESHLIIKAPESEIKQIQSHLRSAGGRQISVS